MRRPPKVDPTDPAAPSAWLAEARALALDLRGLAVDATARKANRRNACPFLREQVRRRFQALRGLLAAQGPAPQPPSTDTPS